MDDFDSAISSLKLRDDEDEVSEAPSPYAMFLEMRQQTTSLWQILKALESIKVSLDANSNAPRPSPS